MTFSQVILFLSIILCLTACNPQAISIEEQPVAASCQPNEPCDYSNTTKIWLPVTDLTPETAFKINLSIPEGSAIISAKLEGVTMYMGYIPVTFEAIDDIYQATTMVGICSEKNMKWKLRLQLQDSEGHTQHITYFFIVRY
ncbi:MULTISPECIES: hypothetical protein [unclassified Pseudoalteromonas]|uniref:hypothetical protein n=1 Tax=unclassified Pseudoalteromonas TaxID=194690 RepID=UPI0025B2EDD8|nr:MULTISPECIES: hypothetical protein [unclassified Pseudoalteromonas]MDN3377325.1 hypothetical protein [Pseudoalteromonas sp. APC 3893]MDN3385507.1 hypothetical protein [Pseudoalteromonas sp. APC 4017]